MACITILTNKAGSHLENTVTRAFERCVQSGIINRSEYQIQVINSLPQAIEKGNITVFDSNCRYDVACAEGVCVASSCCSSAIKSIAQSGARGITCGTGSIDTLSVASCEDGRMMISLQRDVKTLSGGVIEPCEIMVKTDSRPHIYPILATVATLLLCDVPFENGYEI